MADRTVTVRLRADVAQFTGPLGAASASTTTLSRDAARAASSAEAASRRTANALQGTFAGAQRGGAAALGSLESAATRSSQALAGAGAGAARMTQATAQDAVRAAGLTGSAVTRTAATVRAADTSAAASAGQLSATFRASGAAGAAAFGTMESAATRSSQALAASSTRMSAATAAAASGTADLSLANRLALAEAVRAASGEAAATTTAATGYRRLGAAALASAEKQAEGWRTARTGALVLTAVFAAAVAVNARFEKSMSGVAAVSGATAHQMSQLRSTALEAGKVTAYSASEAADAEGELARAGVSVADITGGALKGSLSLAAAGQLSLADAATISAQAMNTFNLRGQDVSHIADVLAAGANKSAADVAGLGLALRQGGLVAHQTGLSLEDTVGVLSAFADHALIGSDAGTSLKTMLQRLTPQSQQAADMMHKIGLVTYDAQGNFVGLTKLAGNMRRAFSGMTPEARNSAMAVIFGSDAVRSANVLYQEGAGGISRYIREVDDSGAASRMAAKQMDNLSGDLETLKGSLEVALIQGGGPANAVLRDMVKWVTLLVNAYASLPGWLQGVVTAFAGIVGVIGLVGASAVLALPKLAAFKTAVTDLAATMPRVTAAAEASAGFMAGPFGIAIGLGVAALTAFGLVNQSTTQDVTDFTEAIKQDSGAIGEHTRQLAAQALAQSGAFEAAKKYGISQQTVEAAALGSANALNQVHAALIAQTAQWDQVGRAEQNGGKGQVKYTADAKRLIDVLNGTNSGVNKAVRSYKDQTAALTTTTGANKRLGDQSLITASDLDKQKSAAEKLTGSLQRLNGVNITAGQDAIQFHSSLADLTSAIHDNGRGMDIATKSGRAVKSAYLDAAGAAMTHAEAVADQTNSVAKGDAALKTDIDQLRKTMRQAGYTTGEIKKLTHAYAQLPKNKTTTITTRYVTSGSRPTGGGRYVMQAFADGGVAHAAEGLLVPGYAPRVDSVPAMLSPGEGVLVPETVRRLGALSGLGAAGVIGRLNTWGRYGTSAAPLLPASRYSTAVSAPSAPPVGGRGDVTVHLYGARQTTAEQARDLARTMTFVG